MLVKRRGVQGWKEVLGWCTEGPARQSRTGLG